MSKASKIVSVITAMGRPICLGQNVNIRPLFGL